MSADPLGEEVRALPLDGITVLDLGQIYQGPYAGFLLAQAGARVIKVEPVSGEAGRRRGANLPHAMLNVGKETVSIDLKHSDGLRLFHRLVKQVDVVLMNYAPGVPERLGIGYDDLVAINPGLVYAHASGFGVRNLDGTISQNTIPAMDITVQAHVGAMSITGHDGEPPLKAGPAFIDFLGGTHLYGAITSALFERERTGRGRSVEVAMADAAWFTLATALGQWQRTGATMRNGNRHAGLGMAPYNVYRCSDGHVAVIVVANRHWRSVLSVIGREDLLDDARLSGQAGRASNIDEVDALVEGWTSTRPKEEVASALQAAHVPAAAVRSVDEVAHDESQHERRALQWIEHPDLGRVPLAASPIRFHESGVAELLANRPLGADNDTVFADVAGLTDAEIDDLHRSGATAPQGDPQ